MVFIVLFVVLLVQLVSIWNLYEHWGASLCHSVNTSRHTTVYSRHYVTLHLRNKQTDKQTKRQRKCLGCLLSY